MTPTSYARRGVIGGGEKYALYVDRALREAARLAGLPLTTTILELDGATDGGQGRDHRQAIAGRAWDPYSISAAALRNRLAEADRVYIHQCLTPVGLFAASHARLGGKSVYGSDAGAGEMELLRADPDAMRVYDAVHAISEFGAIAYTDYPVPIHVIPGPVDAAAFPPAPSRTRDPKLALAVGRLLPHKGYERTIRALPSSMALKIVGQPYDTEYFATLRAIAAGKAVSFLADLDDAGVHALMTQASVFVHASTHVDYRGRFAAKPELLGLAPLEALSTGLTTLVSDAAALAELGALPGCHVFESDDALAALLEAVGSATLPTIPADAMHDAVIARYGLASVGTRLLRMMQVL